MMLVSTYPVVLLSTVPPCNGGDCCAGTPPTLWACCCGARRCPTPTLATSSWPSPPPSSSTPSPRKRCNPSMIGSSHTVYRPCAIGCKRHTSSLKELFHMSSTASIASAMRCGQAKLWPVLRLCRCPDADWHAGSTAPSQTLHGAQVRCLVDVPGERLPSELAEYLTSQVAPQVGWLPVLAANHGHTQPLPVGLLPFRADEPKLPAVTTFMERSAPKWTASLPSRVKV